MIAYIDIETNNANAIVDIGARLYSGEQYHSSSITGLAEFLKNAIYICGHNILHHDVKILATKNLDLTYRKIIDTLYLSPLLFPKRPYHKLVKDDKLDPENSNNPLTDAMKAKTLLEDEMMAFEKLDIELKKIFYGLLKEQQAFRGFFEYMAFSLQESNSNLEPVIKSYFEGKICSNAPIDKLIAKHPMALAYCLAVINVNDGTSILPAWVIKNFIEVHQCFQALRNKPCEEPCSYCANKLDAHKNLQRWFHLDSFREFAGEPLQENAVNAAIQNKSLITIFPTGGGKSITFQLPALIAGETEGGLTVIISPLQSLMKDQVDNLEKKSITDAVTINGSLDPIERSQAIERIKYGGANLLYISPEMLRNNTIERLLQNRHVSRFVIDEAHCFSSWGQDFRVDYLYIGDFIKKLQQHLPYTIPVSCFTATAKQRVIDDIRKYFKDKLKLDLELFTTKVTRTNLIYRVLELEGEENKYSTLRNILSESDDPAIVYVSRTKKAEELADKLVKDGLNAKYYHGQMDSKERQEHQNSFMQGSTSIIVATSAFGMGVDKSNVTKVIHYDISDSLENYMQEAGRAGRDEKIKADCYILYNENDLNKHFILLNQTKLTQKEIQQVWKAIKDLTRTRSTISNSALELARKAGWDDEVAEIETRIKTAVSALEESGYLERGNNSPQLFATGIIPKYADESIAIINSSTVIPEEDKANAIRIIKKLHSSRKRKEAQNDDAETRTDYIADQLGLTNEYVIRIINYLRQEKILADSKDLSAYIRRNPSNKNNALDKTSRFAAFEQFFLEQLNDEGVTINLKELNEKAIAKPLAPLSIVEIKSIINIWAIIGWIHKTRNEGDQNNYYIKPKLRLQDIATQLELRRTFIGTIIRYLLLKADEIKDTSSAEEILVQFSIKDLHDYFVQANQLFKSKLSDKELEDALFYLSRIEAIKIEGGFMVLYNKLRINRLEKNPLIKYKAEDYKKLEDFYLNKVNQIHIVGEYAKKMTTNYKEALGFVDDYFQLNYPSFLNKYFPKRKEELNLKITQGKFNELFGNLSLEQTAIVKDNSTNYICVTAGPGSGKTRVLVHKLASLLQMEDIKHEQLLMLTFSRAASSEFKFRLHTLIGNAAWYVEIKTFHSFCFDLLGLVGDVEKSGTILQQAIDKIRNNDVNLNNITKSVLVIDEAQDINKEEFELIRLLVEKNEDMRVVIVGDDDQNIFEWRGANSDCMKWFLAKPGMKKYELRDNYRSREEIVDLSNAFASLIHNRLKIEPGISKSGSGGIIKITEYGETNLLVPAVNEILSTSLVGSTCILVRTNEDAQIIAGLLKNSAYPVRLLKGNKGFRLSNMLEFRYFSDLILNHLPDNHRIDNDHYTACTEKFRLKFASSSKQFLVLNAIVQVSAEYGTKMYKSDWLGFLADSKLEDFYSFDRETLFVSTIHSAKGKEFDNVFLVLKKHVLRDEGDKREVYVAITRAKSLLSVHYDQKFLLPLAPPSAIYSTDDSVFDEPVSRTISLGHEDIVLSYFFNPQVQGAVNKLVPGDVLYPEGVVGLCDSSGRSVLRFSEAFRKKIATISEKGYKIAGARVDFVVYWKNEEGREVKVVLAELGMQK